MRLSIVFAALALAACATGPKTVALPDGRPGLKLDCSGAAYTFEWCESAAAKACHGPYQVMSKQSSGPYEPGEKLGTSMTFVGSTRTMVVVCGGAPHQSAAHADVGERSMIGQSELIDKSTFWSASSTPSQDIGRVFAGLQPGEVKAVIAQVCVSAQGKVDSVDVTQSSGNKKVDEAAKKLLAQGTYKVPVVDGSPAATCKLMKSEFRALNH